MEISMARAGPPGAGREKARRVRRLPLRQRGQEPGECDAVQQPNGRCTASPAQLATGQARQYHQPNLTSVCPATEKTGKPTDSVLRTDSQQAQ